MVTAVCLLLFVGACGKSAQIPLHVWLPDAMEGPTPVSALIHAATMVTAGVYMVARLAPLFVLSETAMLVVAVVGAATAFMAATIALVQTDIKRVLAYSTVSQLGYMFLACGVGAFGVAVFHLFTHAFFKALLFLGSGSVIHALSGEQDMRRMGGLRRYIPWTFATFLVGTLAIAGIPPLAGFFSKDAILAGALGKHGNVLFAIGLLTALLTAFYMARLLFMTFFGEYWGAEHAHPRVAAGRCCGPLVILAVGSAVGGFVNVPHFVQPVFRLPPPIEGASRLAALGGQPDRGGRYRRRLLPVRDVHRGAGAHRPSLRGPYRLLERKYGFDDLFNWIAGRAVVQGSRDVLWAGLDTAVIDAAVNGTGAVLPLARPPGRGRSRPASCGATHW